MIFRSWPYKNELSGASRILFCTSKKWGGGNDPVWRISYEWILTTTEWRNSEVISKNVDLPKHHRVLCFSFRSSTLLLTRIIKFHHVQRFPRKKNTCMRLGFWCHTFHDPLFDVRLLPTWWTNLSRNLRSFLGYFLMFENFTQRIMGSQNLWELEIQTNPTIESQTPSSDS